MNSFNECKEIVDLNLDPIKVKLMHEESGEGWSRGQVDAVESEYRRFLYLMKFFPNEPIAPLAEADTFWHYHILDTMKYAEDCDAIFGYFLHHFPYVGLRGETDEETHHDAVDRMSQLYEQTFGEPYPRQFRSFEVPNARTARSGNNTALSTRLPQTVVPAVPGIAAKDAMPGSAAARTAFSTRVPLNAVAGSAAKIAFSTRVPQDATTRTAANSAFSTRVPENAVLVGGATAEAHIFKLQRPTLAAA